LIYKKLIKKMGPSNPDTQPFATSVAYQSWMLSQIATEQNDHVNAAEQCRSVLEFQRFLNSADHDSIVSACHKILANQTPTK
jgi:hypothetical protein